MTAEENTAVPEDEATKAEDGSAWSRATKKQTQQRNPKIGAEPDERDAEAADEDETRRGRGAGRRHGGGRRRAEEAAGR